MTIPSAVAMRRQVQTAAPERGRAEPIGQRPHRTTDPNMSSTKLEIHLSIKHICFVLASLAACECVAVSRV